MTANLPPKSILLTTDMMVNRDRSYFLIDDIKLWLDSIKHCIRILDDNGMPRGMPYCFSNFYCSARTFTVFEEDMDRLSFIIIFDREEDALLFRLTW